MVNRATIAAVMDAQLEAWRTWMHERIRPHFLEMGLYRHVFHELRKMSEAKELPASYIFTYLSETYATTQAIAVRRQTDTDPRTASLWRLLREIGRAPQVITRKFYVAEWGEGGPNASEGFDSYAKPKAKYIDGKRVKNDRRALETTAKAVKRYVDQYVAHAEANPTAEIATFNDLNASMDLAIKLYKRYYGLLFPGVYETSPEIGHEWKAVFRVPWIEPRKPRATRLPETSA